MIDYSQQIKAADELANVVDQVIKEKLATVELVSALLNYRMAQAIVDEELREAFDTLQKQLQPV